MWESQLNEDITVDIMIVSFLFFVFIFNILTVTVKRRNKNAVNMERHFSSCSSDVMSITDCSYHFVESSLLRKSQLCVQSSPVIVGLECQ